MRDLTKDSISKHILTMAGPVAVNMFAQIAYQLINLYFITKLGTAATAGTNAAGNVVFIIAALVQIVSVGAVALISQAIGRKDDADANLAFNQSMSLAALFSVANTLLMALLTRAYMLAIASDPATIEAGVTYILWSLPGYILVLPMIIFSSALRAVGVVQPILTIYLVTLIIDAMLAPVLILGWGTGAPLGVKGASIATSVATFCGLILFMMYFRRLQQCMRISLKLMRPQLHQWWRLLTIGIPSGIEMILAFLSTAVVYYTIRDFGSSAQAGLGIGARVLGVVALPAMSIAYAAAPIVGQNYGARNNDRVRETFRQTALLSTAAMIATTVLLQWQPQALLRIFDADTETLATATVYLQLMSWTFVAQGMIYTCSVMFQGMGNTMPALSSSVLRSLFFCILALWVVTLPGFRIEHIWYLWMASFFLQAAIIWYLLQGEFKKRLVPAIA